MGNSIKESIRVGALQILQRARNAFGFAFSLLFLFKQAFQLLLSLYSKAVILPLAARIPGRPIDLRLNRELMRIDQDNSKPVLEFTAYSKLFRRLLARL